MFEFKKYNIADWVSFYRIAAAPFLLLLLLLDDRKLFAILLLISYLSDALDGFLARRLNISTAQGSQLDSVGDQITFIVGFIGIVVFEFQFIEENYILILVIFILNITQQIIAFRKYGKVTAFHTYLAKIAAILQTIFVVWLLLSAPVMWLFYLLIVVAIIEAIEEIALIFMYKNWVSGVKGIYWAKNDARRF